MLNMHDGTDGQEICLYHCVYTFSVFSAFRVLIPGNFAVVVRVQCLQPSVGLLFVISLHTFASPCGEFLDTYLSISISVY